MNCDNVKDFEEEFKKFTGVPFAVSCNNGTAALHLALLASGIQRDDFVLTTPFTFIATSNAILYCGAYPLFADIDRVNHNLDPESARATIEGYPQQMLEHLKAILCVHLFGKACDIDGLVKICDDYNLLLIEDCAQALGVKYKGKHVGRFGSAGCFSFYATKNLSTFEGGMVVSEEYGVAKKAEILANHGQDSKYHSTMIGYNYRLNQVAGLIGATQLRCHPKAITSELESYNIAEGNYPCVIYDQPIYREMGMTGDCPVAEATAREARKYFEKKNGKWG